MTSQTLKARREFINSTVLSCVMFADMNGIHNAEERQDFAAEVYDQLSQWIELPDATTTEEE